KQVAQQLHTQSPSTDNTLVISAAESRKQSLRAILEDANDLQTESTPDTNAQENKNSSNTSNSAIINNHSNENAYSYIAAIGNIMEQFAAVHCDKKSLTTGLNKLHELHESIKSLHAHSSMPAFNQEITAIWEAQHLYLLATAMLEASLARHESRGSFMRDDYPQRDDTNFLTHSMTSKSDTEHATAISWQPVHIIDLPPQQRLY
ncbi:MAG: succinate dehydrogenase, partial [Bifidobacteriaceae bacterium]|nr:succinate dehydrogenase [Bifidobacteriaceae bacterium]